MGKIYYCCTAELMAADHQAINVSTMRPVSRQHPTEASEQSCHITVIKKKKPASRRASGSNTAGALNSMA
jgi:hypothetical protein